MTSSQDLYDAVNEADRAMMKVVNMLQEREDDNWRALSRLHARFCAPIQIALEEDCNPTPSVDEQDQILAQVIARRIFVVGDEHNSPTTRIQFMSGHHLDEVEQGGLCENALADTIYHIIRNYRNP